MPRVLFQILEIVLDMLRDPDKEGQHEVRMCGVFLLLVSLNSAPPSTILVPQQFKKCETVIPEGGISLNA
jgi:hypothetical protein